MLLVLSLFFQYAQAQRLSQVKVNKAQSNTNLHVNIKLIKPTFETSDSIKIHVTISNVLNRVLYIQYDKSNHYRPINTSAHVTDEHETSVTEVSNLDMLSSHIPTNEESEKTQYTMFPLESVSQTYYLKDILVFNYKRFNRLLPGKYNLIIKSNGSLSNKVSFTILH
ncbi:hypothetical protein [Mucilaginibacter aquariorum]|uniref:hypothetical protein n=1 Tax=Mucilaginibacter aquariorum TaxID=2967225 RepID=UPI002115A91B|nr:hypothetical protein [Mucilaginibacter aquariorum]